MYFSVLLRALTCTEKMPCYWLWGVIRFVLCVITVVKGGCWKRRVVITGAGPRRPLHPRPPVPRHPPQNPPGQTPHPPPRPRRRPGTSAGWPASAGPAQPEQGTPPSLAGAGAGVAGALGRKRKKHRGVARSCGRARWRRRSPRGCRPRRRRLPRRPSPGKKHRHVVCNAEVYVRENRPSNGHERHSQASPAATGRVGPTTGPSTPHGPSPAACPRPPGQWPARWRWRCWYWYL